MAGKNTTSLAKGDRYKTIGALGHAGNRRGPHKTRRLDTARRRGSKSGANLSSLLAFALTADNADNNSSGDDDNGDYERKKSQPLFSVGAA